MFSNTNNSSATTTLEEPLVNFPWPFLDAVDDMAGDDHLLSINNVNAPAGEEGQEVNATETETNVISKGGVMMIRKQHGASSMKVPSKRRGKKDRHSKICTAQGLRDRRMRLSLKVARKFFDLQDMLGFDKASKTIDWLFINSRDAIHQIMTTQPPHPPLNFNMSFSASDRESQVDSEAYKDMEIKPTGEESKPPGGKRKRSKSCNNVAITINPVARESRDKARARARERTKEKLMIRSNTQYHSKHHLQVAAAVHEDSTQEIITSLPRGETQAVMKELLGITRSSSSSTFSPDFSNHNNDFPGLWSSIEEARIEPAAGCYAVTTKPSQGNVKAQNINNTDAIFKEQNKLCPSSTFITISSNGEQWNPRSAFSTAPCTQDQQNHSPNSILMSNSLQEILLTTPVFTATNSNVCFQPIFPPNQFM